MKTAEEIWNEQFELCYSKAIIKPTDAVLNSMEQYSQQQACEFAEWASANEFIVIKELGIWEAPNRTKSAVYSLTVQRTTAELYNQWKGETNNG